MEKLGNCPADEKKLEEWIGLAFSNKRNSWAVGT
jgi:hypothetical protein